jgi:hypothetical protein
MLASPGFERHCQTSRAVIPAGAHGPRRPGSSPSRATAWDGHATRRVGAPGARVFSGKDTVCEEGTLLYVGIGGGGLISMRPAPTDYTVCVVHLVRLS